jgi:hypothetical protein
LRHSGIVVCPVLGTSASRLIFAVVRAGAQHDGATAAVLSMLKTVAAERFELASA